MMDLTGLPPSHEQYKENPQGYITDVLKLTLTLGMREVLSALMAEPHKVLVSAGHSVGKSTLGAALVNWWFDSRKPAICLTTAPTDRQVKDILWKEVRTQRARAGLPDRFIGPKAPRLETSPDHFAVGFTARDATRFQGQHSPGGVFIVFDEAEGVEADFWQPLPTMLDGNSYFVGFYNPTGSQTACHQAEQREDRFRKVRLSCLDHPNISAALAGLEPPIKGAITLKQLEDMLLEDSQLLPPGSPVLPTDVVLNGRHYRPGPIAEARCLGRRSLSGTTTLWSELLWQAVLQTRWELLPEWPVQLGVDVGRYGDDASVIFVRKGYCIIHAETHVKQPTDVIAERIKEVAQAYSDAYNPKKQIPCLIDEGGIGAGVIDQGGDWNFIGINASCSPRNPQRFRLIRDELWFTARQAANERLLDVSRLPPALLSRLWAELQVCKYQVVPGKDIVRVNSKDEMKEVLKRSPDTADAFNLCCYPAN